MKRVFVLAVSAIMLGSVVTAASAQGGRGQGRGGQFGGGLGMLMMPEVQDELKMTQPQKDKVQTKNMEVQQALQEARQGFDFQNATPEERQKLQAKTAEITNKAIADVLDSTQMKRYKQLELQQALNTGGGFGGFGRRGGGAAGGGQTLGVFGRKEVADELKLSDKQKSDISKAYEELNQARMELFQGLQQASPEERQAAMGKMQGLQKTATDKALAVLTDEQKAKWKALTGEPFKFPAFGGPRRQPQA